MSTSNDLFLPQDETWINEKTGEKVTGPLNIRKVSRENFEIVYATALYDLHEEFGSRKLKVFDVILKNRNIDNITIMTQERIAEIAEVSEKTVRETMKVLERKGAIRRRNGVIFVNPQLMNRGSAEKEKWLIIKFQEFEQTKSITRGKKKQQPKISSEFTREQRKERKQNKEKLRELQLIA